MPLIEIGNQTLDIKLNLLRRRGATHGNSITMPPLLIKQTPQQLHKGHEIWSITRIHDIPRISIIHAITRKVFPINADALEDRPLLKEVDDTLGEGLTGRGGSDGKRKVLGPSPATDCQCEVEGTIELVVEFCELAEEPEVLGWGGPRVLGVDAIADKWVLKVGPAAEKHVSRSLSRREAVKKRGLVTMIVRRRGGRGGLGGLLRVARDDDIVSSSGILDVEKGISNVGDAIHIRRQIGHLEIARIIGPVSVVDNALFVVGRVL